MFLLLAVFIVTLLGFYWFQKWNTVWRYSEKIPGKPTLPLVGNAHQFGLNPVDYLKNMMECWKTFDYGIFRVWFGPELYVVVTDPKEVEIILSSVKHIDKMNDYRFLHPWLGNGLITSTGQIWHKHRKMITPSFHFNILNIFHTSINKGANLLAKKLEKLNVENKGAAMDIQDLINLSTLDIICDTAMGVEVNALDNPDSNIVGAFHDISASVYNRIYSAWKRFDILHRFTDDYVAHQKALHILLSLNKEVILKRREVLADTMSKEDGVNNNSDMEGINERAPYGKRQPKAFLDTLLTATIDGRLLNDKEIDEEVSTFIFAGHDTTAAAISFIIYHLSIHKDEQKKVYDEQLSILGSHLDQDPTYQEIQEMRYLDLFIKESQRLVPSVPFIGRLIKEKINLNGTIVPANSNIALFLYAMGHNPKVFPDPEKFDPERFLSDARTNKDPFEYVPFSAGLRNCVGQKFALLELKTVISKLVRTFHIDQPDEGFTAIIASTATTRSANGIHVKLTKRK